MELVAVRCVIRPASPLGRAQQTPAIDDDNDDFSSLRAWPIFK